MPAGPPLTQCPPDRGWLMPAGSPLTQARRIGTDSWPLAASNPIPVDRVHITARSAVPCPQRHVLSCVVSTGAVLIQSCQSCPRRLVWGRRRLLLWPRRPFQPPAPLSLKWRRSLRDPVWASDSRSCPEEASASKPAQEGFWFLWAVLSCLSGPGVLSCTVLCV